MITQMGYRGEIKCRFKHISRTKKYTIGNKVAQLIIMPIAKVELEETNLLTETERNVNGFGSTGA